MTRPTYRRVPHDRRTITIREPAVGVARRSSALSAPPLRGPSLPLPSPTSLPRDLASPSIPYHRDSSSPSAPETNGEYVDGYRLGFTLNADHGLWFGMCLSVGDGCLLQVWDVFECVGGGCLLQVWGVFECVGGGSLLQDWGAFEFVGGGCLLQCGRLELEVRLSVLLSKGIVGSLE
ncbi:hypothetical protein Droror1_Dr00024854 [Drosera rotundifolia]